MEEACGKVKCAKTLARLEMLLVLEGRERGAGKRLVQHEVQELRNKQPSYTGLCGHGYRVKSPLNSSKKPSKSFSRHVTHPLLAVFPRKIINKVDFGFLTYFDLLSGLNL